MKALCASFLLVFAGVTPGAEPIPVREPKEPNIDFAKDDRARQAALLKLQKETTFAAFFSLEKGVVRLEQILKGGGCEVGEELLKWRTELYVGKELLPGERIIIVVGLSPSDPALERLGHKFQLTDSFYARGDWIISGKLSKDRTMLIEDRKVVYRFHWAEVFPETGREPVQHQSKNKPSEKPRAEQAAPSDGDKPSD